MKTKLLVALIITFVFGSFQMIAAEPNQQFKLQVNKQKVITKDKLKITFVSVLEDSRCPIGVNCIWAGNARLQLKISQAKGASKTFELNTNLQPQVFKFEGYEIKLVDLTPTPKANIRINHNGYTATVSVNSLSK